MKFNKRTITARNKYVSKVREFNIVLKKFRIRRLLPEIRAIK